MTIKRCGGLAAFLLVWLAFALAPRVAHAQGDPVAVIVHPANTESGMTSARLCDTLLGERQRWSNGELIQVLVPARGSKEWEAVVRAACRTNEVGFSRRLGASRAFGRVSRAPQPIATSSEMTQRVAASPRALGFVVATAVESTVRVLPIDGKSPTDSEYPIQTQR